MDRRPLLTDTEFFTDIELSREVTTVHLQRQEWDTISDELRERASQLSEDPEHEDYLYELADVIDEQAETRALYEK